MEFTLKNNPDIIVSDEDIKVGDRYINVRSKFVGVCSFQVDADAMNFIKKLVVDAGVDLTNFNPDKIKGNEKIFETLWLKVVNNKTS